QNHFVNATAPTNTQTEQHHYGIGVRSFIKNDYTTKEKVTLSRGELTVQQVEPTEQSTVQACLGVNSEGEIKAYAINNGYEMLDDLEATIILTRSGKKVSTQEFQTYFNGQTAEHTFNLNSAKIKEI